MGTYEHEPEQPSKGKQLCDYGQIELLESISLFVKGAIILKEI